MQFYGQWNQRLLIIFTQAKCKTCNKDKNGQNSEDATSFTVLSLSNMILREALFSILCSFYLPVYLLSSSWWSHTQTHSALRSVGSFSCYCFSSVHCQLFVCIGGPVTDMQSLCSSLSQPSSAKQDQPKLCEKKNSSSRCNGWVNFPMIDQIHIHKHITETYVLYNWLFVRSEWSDQFHCWDVASRKISLIKGSKELLHRPPSSMLSQRSLRALFLPPIWFH